MKRDGTWLREEEIWPKEEEDRAILMSVVPEPASPEVTHVDIAVSRGTGVNPVWLASPPQAIRFVAGSSFSVFVQLPAAGDYIVYAFRKRLPPLTMPVHMDERPTAREFHFPM
jgi:hypothetical protein